MNTSVNKVQFSKKKGGIHRIFFGDPQEYLESKGIIIATGSRSNYLGIDREKKFMGLGISFCAICDGFFHRDKEVVIVGGGDTALEEANYLSKICKNVYVVVRKSYLKASKTLQKRIEKKNNVKILFCSVIKEIIGKKFLEGVMIFNKKYEKDHFFSISGMFIAIGHTPNTEIFQDQVNLDNRGYIIVNNGGTKTNLPGIFAAGEVMDPNYRQAITSAGTGCMASLDLDQYLSYL